MTIESKENKKIKYLNKLRLNKYMNEEKKFIVEGNHLVEEAYKSGILLETYSTSDTNYNVLNNIVSESVMNYISNLSSKSNIIGICKFIEDKKIGDRIIILDNVQNPGNIGTIIRSCNAFNFDTIVLSNTSVSKYNEKLIRASQGMLFKTNVIVRNLTEFITELKNDNYMVYATDVVNGIDVKDINNKEKIAVVMGNEGTGVSNDIKGMCDKSIYIKINDLCESLNVSVAASIIMYEINKE